MIGCGADDYGDGTNAYISRRRAMMARKRSSCPWVVASHENVSAWERVAERGGGSAKRRRMALEKAAGVRSRTRMPAAGALTTSGVPHTSEATTGVLQAIASSKTLAHPSRLDARMRASAAL